MKWIAHLCLSVLLFVYTMMPGMAYASQKGANEASLPADSSAKQANKKQTGEKNYLIGLKKGIKSDEFIKKKGYQKKQKKPKKTKRANFVFVSLDQTELKNVQQDADVSFIEEDALVQIDTNDLQKQAVSGEGAEAAETGTNREQNSSAGGQSAGQTGGQPAEQSGEQPGGQPDEQSATQPGGQLTEQPGDQSTEQPGGQPTEQPGDLPTEQPVSQPTEQPGDQPTEQPGTPVTEPEQPVSTETVPWGIKAIGGEHVLEQNAEGAPMKIAVLDTGIATHPDLRLAGGVSFVPDTTDPTDDNGHGTHVAGIIGALHNEVGVVGAAPHAELYSVKVLDRDGTGTYSQVIQGIEWAIENKMNIITMSFGGSMDSQALQEAIQLAHDKGILLIAAAGNKGAGDETETYPALFPQVLSVGAVNQANKRASFSSTGAELDLVAPGVDIESTLQNGTYGVMSGTSMAAPHVAGAAAALWSARPDFSAEEVTARLYETATPLGNTNEYGHGLVNEAYALGLIAGPVNPPDPVEPSPPSPSDDAAFVQTYDQKAAGIVKKLQALQDIALKQGNTELAKEIEQRLHDFMIINMDEHQLPVELEQASKEEMASSAWEDHVNQFYETKKNVFLTLADTYQRQNDKYEQQLLGSLMGTQSEATAAADTYEPNDSFETAYPLSADNMVYSSYLSTETDVDFYSFTPTVAGTVRANLIPPDGTDYDLIVLDSNRNVVAAAQEGVGVWEKLDFFVEANKTYYVLVWGASGFSAKNAYQLIISKVAAELNPNKPLDIDLPAGSSQIFQITPDATGAYSMYTGPYGGIGGTNDTILELYSDPYLSSLIATNDDANNMVFSEIVANLTAGTTYYVKLSAYGSNPIHARLAATVKKTALSLDVPVDVNLPAKTSQLYQFVATGTGPYKVGTDYFGGKTTSGANDTVVAVYRDPNETHLVAFNDDYNGTTFSQTSFPTVAGNIYYIKITGYNGGTVYARLAASKDPALSLESNVIRESPANDGSIVATQLVTLVNGTFATDMSTGVTVNNLPAGLGISIARVSSTQLRIAFTGKATNHANVNDVANASVTIAKEKITGAAASVTSGLFAFDCTDSTLITVVNPIIPEANINDGSFAAKLVATLSSGSFATDMSTGVTIAHLPAGLGFTVKRDSDTQITISFTGKALIHANANDVTDAFLTIAKAKITGATADGTSGMFTFDFIDEPRANDTYTYQYDKENHLVAILKNGVAYVEFAYDANGNLLTKTIKN